MLVFPLDPGSPEVASSVASVDETKVKRSLGISVAEDLVAILAVNARWQVSAFHLDDSYVVQSTFVQQLLVPPATPGGGGTSPGGGIPPPGPGTIPPPAGGVGPETGGTGGVPPSMAPNPTVPAPPTLPPFTPPPAIPPVAAPPTPPAAGAPATPAAPPALLQQVVMPADTSTQLDKPAIVANLLSFHYFLAGTVQTLQYTPSRRTATATLTATVFEAIRTDTPCYSVRRAPAASPLAVTGRYYVRRGMKADISAAEHLALQDAEQKLAAEILDTGIMPTNPVRAPVKSNKGHSALGTVLPILAGLLLIGAIALAAHGTSHSSNSSTATVATLAAPASAVITSGTATPVILTFSQSTSGSLVAKYVITRYQVGSGGVLSNPTVVDGNVTPNPGSGSLIAVDSNATVGVTYEYTVQAIGITTTSVAPVSTSVVFVTANGSPTIDVGQPSAPSALSVTATTTSAVSLSWAGSSSSFVSGYAIFRSLGGGAESQVSSVINGTTFTDNSPSLVVGNTYTYTVRAISNTAPPVQSVDSNAVSVTIP